MTEKEATYDETQIAQRLQSLSGWYYEDGWMRRVLFVTGTLAAPALQRVLTAMAPPFVYDVKVLGITVAALMTTAWIARHLDVPPGTDLVLIPGLCEGDPELIREKCGIRVEKG